MEPQQPALTRVVFRIWPDGEVLAVMPEMPAVAEGYCCSYSLRGDQAVRYDEVLRQTRAATKEEYWYTHVVLERMGFRLKICRKISYLVHANRWRAWQKLMKETRDE